MERESPVRKPHTSTADLLAWSETPRSDHSSAATRSHQPSDGISKALFGGQVTDEEAQALNKKKNCSGYKLKEMTGSGIFSGRGNSVSESDDASPSNKTGLRYYQQTLNGMSQVTFSADGAVSPKKPTTLPEVAKQRELSGTLQAESDSKNDKKQMSDAKIKEISGHDIFGSPPEIQPHSSATSARSQGAKESIDMGEPAPRNLRTSVKVSNSSNVLFSEESVVKPCKKIHNQKFQELTGNDIFKGDGPPPGSAERQLSSAKLRKMNGNNIFADGKSESRDYFGGVRKPPGGESSISLV